MQKALFGILVLLAGCGKLVPSKETTTTPMGIVTEPNELGELPNGTMSIATNVQIRRPFVLEPRNAFSSYTPYSDLAAGYYPAKMKTFGSNTYVVAREEGTDNTKLYVQTAGAGGSSEISVTDRFIASMLFAPGKTHMTQTRGRLFVTETFQPLVIEGNAARQAGLPMPSYIEFANLELGETLQANNFTAYRAVFTREIDQYTIRGAVSGAYGIENTSGFNFIPVLRVRWDSLLYPVREGDQIELYRVPQQSAAALLGDEFQFARKYTITATDITNGYADIADTCLDDNLGADLYTNPSQEGASKANWMPPPSVDVATFNGATFYAATSAWHLLTISVPYTWGSLSTSDAQTYGIGLFTKTGTYVSGIAQITGVPTNLGLAVGQQITAGVDFPVGTYITSISGAGPYTLGTSNPPSGSAVGATITYNDVIVFSTPGGNNVAVYAGLYDQFLKELAQLNSAGTVTTVALPVLPAISPLNYAGPSVTGATLQFTHPVPYEGFSIKATNGSRYSPPLPEFTAADGLASTNDPRTNRLFISKPEQPEAVAPDSQIFVGHGTILRVLQTQNSALVYCTDGIFEVTGNGVNWAVQPFNPDVILLATDALDSIDNAHYGLTTEGLTEISSTNGVSSLSDERVGSAFDADWTEMQAFTDPIPYSWGVQLQADHFRRELWVNLSNQEPDPSGGGSDPAYKRTWVYNFKTKTFVQQNTAHIRAMSYSELARTLVVADDATEAFQIINPSLYMRTVVRFNPAKADVGYLKQWLDVTLHMQDLSATANILPEYSATSYPAPYSITGPLVGDFSHVVPLLQNYAYDKKCTFGWDMSDNDTAPYFKLVGLSYRFRVASETLAQSTQ